jgi:hypothetical protein
VHQVDAQGFLADEHQPHKNMKRVRVLLALFVSQFIFIFART